MRLEYQIAAALLLDFLIGDPRWFPHPVKLIGRLAASLEAPARRLLPWPRIAGIAAALIVAGITGFAAWGLVHFAGLAHPAAGIAVSILLIYLAIAARDLARHSTNVFRSLEAADLDEARRRVAMIAGRDTAQLDEPELVRAAAESVAESTVDGVTSPLFYAALFGPVGSMVYKAVNTLDSTFGFKDDRYLKFGWASARLDDAANFVPARLTAPLISAAAALLGQRPLSALRITLRDARKHHSPNAGFPEAAFAGAMGVRLGGLNFYGGQPVDKPAIGDAVVPLARRHIPAANRLMFATTLLFLAVCLAGRVAALHLWHTWRAAA